MTRILRLFRLLALRIEQWLRPRRGHQQAPSSAVSLVDAGRVASTDLLPQSVRRALRRLVSRRDHQRQERFCRLDEDPRLCADSARLRIALADLYERAGNDARVFELLDEMPHPEQSGRITMRAAHYAWFCGDTDRALRYIQPIIDAYYDLETADETFLFVRGLPFVTDTLYFAVAMHALRDDLPAARALLSQAQQRIADLDLSDMMLFLDCKQRQDFRPLLEAREKEMKLEFTGGIVPTQVAILEAQLMDDPNAAVASLGRIVLPPHYHPWLNDVLLLAVCHLAGRSGDIAQEQKLQRDFLARQPLLLQPNHALLFNLLEYQEALKPEAHEARRS